MPTSCANCTVFKPEIAVIDACVLYPFHLRNIIVQAAVDRLTEARWTNRIHDEWMRNLIANHPSLSIERLRVTRRLMDDALPAAMVNDFETHIPKVVIPDPDDRHVVAAGIAARATVIVTWNAKHFPSDVLAKFGLRRETPDVYLSAIFRQAPDLLVGSLANARGNLSKSDVSAIEFVEIMRRQGLVALADRLQHRLGAL